VMCFPGINNVPTIQEIKCEAIIFRELIDKCDKEKTELIRSDFPVMSCKLSSMLLAFHFLKIWPDIKIIGISAAAKYYRNITHYWLEIDDLVIDITGDQYNILEDCHLNKSIISQRPFQKVHIANKNTSYLYKIFKVRESEIFVFGFPEIGDDFIEQMKLSHIQLLEQ
ncbi:hypothetical protein M3P05_20465, partial [Sansalvadorimonas sp. 2012CJ34-2]